VWSVQGRAGHLGINVFFLHIERQLAVGVKLSAHIKEVSRSTQIFHCLKISLAWKRINNMKKEQESSELTRNNNERGSTKQCIPIKRIDA